MVYRHRSIINDGDIHILALTYSVTWMGVLGCYYCMIFLVEFHNIGCMVILNPALNGGFRSETYGNLHAQQSSRRTCRAGRRHSTQHNYFNFPLLPSPSIRACTLVLSGLLSFILVHLQASSRSRDKQVSSIIKTCDRCFM